MPVVKIRCFAAGETREIPVKVLRNLYWRKAGPDLRLQLVVVKPLGYRLRKGSKLLYRQPAFLLCTDPELDLQTLVQAYVDRWEIECHHRDEKSFILKTAAETPAGEPSSSVASSCSNGICHPLGKLRSSWKPRQVSDLPTLPGINRRF